MDILRNDYDLKILFISFFSIFYYCQKSIRTFEKQNDGINGMVIRNSIDSSKKGVSFDIIVIMDI
jgi:hypothetical protein